MTAKWKDSIRGKLTSIIMLTSTTVVLLACLGFAAQDIIDERHDLDSDLTAVGGMVASNSSAALTFGDQKAAREVLSALKTRPSIIAGCLYTTGGEPFVTYFNGTVSSLPPLARAARGIVRRNGRVEFFEPIVLDGERVGTVYIVSDLRDLRARMKEDAYFVAVILIVCLVVAFILSSRLQRSISGPIVGLARVAGSVSQNKNYSMRASRRRTGDSTEIGNLVTGFNGMLAEIEQRDDKLLRHQLHLEEMVALRTSELTVAKDAAEKIGQLNARLARESALILNSATDGILGIDLDNRFTFINPAAERMLGMTLDEVKGKSVHEALHHSYPDGRSFPEADCANTQAMRRGESTAMTADTFWRRDGTSFPVEYSTTPMVDQDGAQLGSVVMFRDVTERRAIDRLKSEFVSTVSHELRTPLTSIRGALGLLSSGLLGPIAEKAERMLEIAVNNTDRLVRLINDILDLERIDSGKVELARTSVDANAVMVQASEGLQTIADEAGIRVVLLPATATLWGDSDRIIQTLTNLLGNAIKFSPRDTIVTLSGTAHDGYFTFSVADQGRGIPEEKLESIFERFSQVDASDSRDKGGSGLGLAICQSIVHAHGGRIRVEKNDPVGTRFQFTIPLAVPLIDAAPAAAPLAMRTILVCQDEGSPAIAETLQRQGFHVVTATSGDVIAHASGVHPDAIVLDLAYGEKGIDIVGALKSSAETRDIPIVVATGHMPDSQESYAAAVANWIHQPMRSDELIHALDLVCGTPSILVVEDDPDLARVMITALEGHGIRTFHALTGSEAVELCRQHEPTLIVLDLILPDMDGFAVVSSLRESATLRRIPLLVYSALDVGSADQSRLRLGPTQFLTKSRCSLADFEKHVVRLLETVTNSGKEVPHAA